MKVCIQKASIGAMFCFFAFALVADLKATLHVEVGDAGNLIPTAHTLPGGTTEVTGTLMTRNDQDLFCFSWGGGSLDIEVTSALGFDSQIFLFDAVGSIVGADDDSGAGSNSLLSGDLTGGDYILAVTAFNWDPTNGDGQQLDNLLNPNNSYQPGVVATTLMNNS